MTGRSDRLACAVAAGLLACLALAGGLIEARGNESTHRSPAPTEQFFVVALA